MVRFSACCRNSSVCENSCAAASTTDGSDHTRTLPAENGALHRSMDHQEGCGSGCFTGDKACQDVLGIDWFVVSRLPCPAQLR